MKFLVIFIFLVIVLVQFCIILVRNGMFSRNKRSSDLVINFYYVIDVMYIYSWKKLIKFWPVLVIQLRKNRFFLFADGSQLDNVVTSPCVFSSGCVLKGCFVWDRYSWKGQITFKGHWRLQFWTLFWTTQQVLETHGLFL